MSGETATWMSMTFPLLRRLGTNICLVKHPNGPCVIHGGSLMTLDHAVTCESLPAEIREAAVAAYRELTWPLVKDKI